MTAPLPPQDFALLLRRAGLNLPPAEAEALRLAHPRLQAMLEALRDPPNAPGTEPAFAFQPDGGRR